MSLGWIVSPHGYCSACGKNSFETPEKKLVLTSDVIEIGDISLCLACLEDARLTLEHAIETDEKEKEDA